MLPIPPLKVDVKAEKSCNKWFCCFKGNPEVEDDSPVSMETVETVTRTFEKHRHSHTPPNIPQPPKLERKVAVLSEQKEESK